MMALAFTWHPSQPWLVLLVLVGLLIVVLSLFLLGADLVGYLRKGPPVTQPSPTVNERNEDVVRPQRGSVGISIRNSRDVNLYNNTITGFDTGVDVVDSNVEARNNRIVSPPGAPNRAARRVRLRPKREPSPPQASRESGDKG